MHRLLILMLVFVSLVSADGVTSTDVVAKPPTDVVNVLSWTVDVILNGLQMILAGVGSVVGNLLPSLAQALKPLGIGYLLQPLFTGLNIVVTTILRGLGGAASIPEFLRNTSGGLASRVVGFFG